MSTKIFVGFILFCLHLELFAKLKTTCFLPKIVFYNLTLFTMDLFDDAYVWGQAQKAPTP